VDHTITPTWATVELPILRAIVQADIDGDDLTAAARAACGDDERFARRLDALHEAGYIEAKFMHANNRSYGARVVRPTAEARRAVGQWPTADGLATELAAAFDRAADLEDDVDRKLSYREAAKAIVTGVATTAITKYMGL
jgi:hypothetical protein